MRSEVLIADAEAGVVSSIEICFAEHGWTARTLAGDDDVVAVVLDRSPSCVLLDVQHRQQSLARLDALRSRGYGKPILAMSGVLDIPTIVASIKRGADDFIRTTEGPGPVFNAVSRAVAAWTARQAQPDCRFGEKFKSHAALSGREMDILRGIAAGATAKEAATRLELSPRTVEFYRSRLLSKLGARNAADLMRIVME
ncbi:MAG: LuxR C-terminal-related transcriptional regulator [Tardiphaga sp.]